MLGFTKQALLRVVLPVAAVIAVLYGLLNYKSSSQRWSEQYADDLKAKADAAMAPSRAAAELARQRAANHPDAKRLEAELSQLTPEQRAKRVGELMEEFAKKARAGQ